MRDFTHKRSSVTRRERELADALRFIAACPAIYYSQGPEAVVKNIEQAARQALALYESRLERAHPHAREE